MTKRSIWAVVAGLLAVVIVTTVVDMLLYALRVYPPGQPLTHGLALLATAYRIVIGTWGGWLTARLAPARPMKHAAVLGLAGALVALAGLIVTWNLGLGPRWYPVALVLLAVPQCLAGGRIYERQQTRGAGAPSRADR